MPQAIKTLFPKFEVFEFLLAEDYETLEQYMFRYQYDEGQYVFKEGAHGGYLCFIVEGEDLGIANRVMMGIAGLLSGSLRETTQAFSEQTLSLC